MDKRPIAVTELALQPFSAYVPEGALLVSGADPEHCNPMTISWGAFGIMWGKPVVMVMVRQSRHTYQIISSSPDFTVNWMPPAWTEAVRLCGSASGRDMDKFAATGMHPVRATVVSSPVIAESILSLECRTLYRVNVNPADAAQWLDPGVLTECYGNQDFHRLFFGELVAATGAEAFVLK